MWTNELLNSSVDDEEVVDEALEASAVDFASWTNRFAAIGLQVVEKMLSVFVGIGVESKEADAAKSRRHHRRFLMSRWRKSQLWLQLGSVDGTAL